MSRIQAKRPSPALVISLLALFVALGGSAYAASKIGTKQIKNGAVTAAKIKKNAVTGTKIKKGAITAAKIKNGSVTGAKIKLSSLGTVPSATNAGHASSADHAGSADNATNAANFSRYFTSGLKKVPVGQTVALANVGPFSFSGVCEDRGGGEYKAWVKVTTSAAGSFLYSEGTYDYQGDFEPGEEGVASEASESASPEWLGYYGYYNEFYAASPSGDVLLEGHANNGVHVFGADCAFALNFINEA
jgi:hypothetical protein